MIQYMIVFAVVGATLTYVISNIIKRLRTSDNKTNPCQGCNASCSLKCKK